MGTHTRAHLEAEVAAAVARLQDYDESDEAAGVRLSAIERAMEVRRMVEDQAFDAIRSGMEVSPYWRQLVDTAGATEAAKTVVGGVIRWAADVDHRLREGGPVPDPAAIGDDQEPANPE